MPVTITTSMLTAAVPTAVIVTAAGSRTVPPITITARPPHWYPWMIMEGEDTPNRAYWQHYRDDLNSLHPSCSAASPTPMDTEEVRTVTYREDRGPNTRNQARRETRRDRERRGGMAR